MSILPLCSIDAGADVYKADSTGLTPLHLAVYFARPKVIRHLIDTGAKVAACANQEHDTFLHLAVRYAVNVRETSWAAWMRMQVTNLA